MIKDFIISIDESLCDEQVETFVSIVKEMTELYANHFDYRGLIKKGLALEAPEGMYNKIK